MVSTVVWDGNAGFECREIKAQGKQSRLDIKGVKGTYRFDIADDQTTMSGQALFSMEGLAVKDLTVDGASIRFLANGLNVKGYEEFMRLYGRNLSEHLNRMAAVQGDPEKVEEIMKQQKLAFGIKMMSAYEKLLKAGLELQVADMMIELAQGKIEGDMTLRLMKDLSLLQLIPLVRRPELLLDMVYLKSNIRLPAGLVKDKSKLLKPLVPGMKAGLFVQNGELLVHAAETANGKLRVNGEQVDLTRRKSTPMSHDRGSK
jgi:hypothetical protein